MITLREWASRLRGTVRGRRTDRDLDDELRLHVELAAEDERRRGRSPDDAGRAASLRSGGVAQAMEALRDQRGLPWLDDLGRDVGYAARGMRRSPGFAAAAILTLALGIGSNVATFSLVNGVLLMPLRYSQSEQLMSLTAEFSALGLAGSGLSAAEYRELRQVNQSFAEVGAYATGGGGYTTGEVNVMAEDRPLRVRSMSVDAHLLEVLRLQPAQGRFFRDDETSTWAGALAPPLVILSHELWQNAFGGQPLVGETVDVEGRPHEVLGIMPAGADVADNRTAIWLPLWLHPNAARQRDVHALSVVARLKEGVTAEAAQLELSALLDDWGERAGTTDHVPTSRPTRATDHSLRMRPLQEAVVGSAGRTIWVLQAAVGVVLLIVCTNLASLVLARGESRRREFALRLALGARRNRLLRQTLTEGLLLSVLGALLGLWLAHAGVRALLVAWPGSLPRAGEVGVNVTVLIFAFGVATATGFLFALTSMAEGSGGLLGGLQQDDRRAVGASRHHVRRVLVMAEVALAVTLLVAAGLLIRTVHNLSDVDAGFDRSRLVTFSMTLPMATSEPATRAQAYQRLIDGLRAARVCSRPPSCRACRRRVLPSRSARESRTTCPPTGSRS